MELGIFSVWHATGVGIPSISPCLPSYKGLLQYASAGHWIFHLDSGCDVFVVAA